jgi:hypothetical protein
LRMNCYQQTYSESVQMPRYRFEFVDEPEAEPVYVELEDDQAARDEARRALAEGMWSQSGFFEKELGPALDPEELNDIRPESRLRSLSRRYCLNSAFAEKHLTAPLLQLL